MGCWSWVADCGLRFTEEGPLSIECAGPYKKDQALDTGHMNTIIRTAFETDLPRLTEIYNHYITETAATFDIKPFSIEERRAWQRQFKPLGRHQLIVASAGDEVLGYACSSQLRPKAAYDCSVEVSVYLAPENRGQGIGTQLYATLFGRLSEEDIHRAYAVITLPNDASRRLHEKFGFKRVGLFREVGRKFEKYWDVEWMEKELG